MPFNFTTNLSVNSNHPIYSHHCSFTEICALPSLTFVTCPPLCSHYMCLQFFQRHSCNPSESPAFKPLDNEIHSSVTLTHLSLPPSLLPIRQSAYTLRVTRHLKWLDTSYTTLQYDIAPFFHTFYFPPAVHTINQSITTLVPVPVKSFLYTSS